MKFLLTTKSIWLPQGMAIARMIVGALMIYHGQEVFNSELMKGYITWDNFNNPYGKYLVYAGKTSELVSGVFLFLGLFTRIGAILLTGAMLYITFFVGHGRFWYEDQHPFMIAMTGFIFFFIDRGFGVWIKSSIEKNNNNYSYRSEVTGFARAAFMV